MSRLCVTRLVADCGLLNDAECTVVIIIYSARGIFDSCDTCEGGILPCSKVRPYLEVSHKYKRTWRF